MLNELLGSRVSIKVYDHRWKKSKQTGSIDWKGDDEDTERNRRREQVVTIQSKQYLSFPEPIRQLFTDEAYTSCMWPLAQSEVLYPRNIRISDLEDNLLKLANQHRENITLIPSRFDAQSSADLIKSHHLLAICEGASSETRTHFEGQFGPQGEEIFSLDQEKPLRDLVLGLKVRSTLSLAAVVALTISQNRFLLNMRNGEGYLNMRLTDDEAKEVKGNKTGSLAEVPCIQQHPCILVREGSGNDFRCKTHDALFFPARHGGSQLMPRINEGLRLFGVKPEDLEKITMWRLSMTHTCRFTSELYPGSSVFGALLGDAANSIHFWAGRGLNSGLASAISLARCLQAQIRQPKREGAVQLNEAGFAKHEGIMAQLQYRHKTRAWRAMVSIDGGGKVQAIKHRIQQSMSSREIEAAALSERCHSAQMVLQNDLKNDEVGNLVEATKLPEMSSRIKLIRELEPNLAENKKVLETLEKQMKEVSDSLVIIEEEVYRKAMQRRVEAIVEGLTAGDASGDKLRRMPQDQGELTNLKRELAERLNQVNSETLRTLYFSEPWNTRAVAGPEVDIDALFPDVERMQAEKQAEQARKQKWATDQQEELKRARGEAEQKVQAREREHSLQLSSALDEHRQSLDAASEEHTRREKERDRAHAAHRGVLERRIKWLRVLAAGLFVAACYLFAGSQWAPTWLGELL